MTTATKPARLKIGYYYTITLDGKTWRGLVVGIHENTAFGKVTVGVRAEDRNGTYLYDDIANNAVEVGPAENVEDLKRAAVEAEASANIAGCEIILAVTHCGEIDKAGVIGARTAEAQAECAGKSGFGPAGIG